jgi:hypothetical protein
MSSLYDTLDGSVLHKAGGYALSDIRIISYQTTEGSTPDVIDIESMVVDLNIYESIHNKTLSGNMVIVDTNNIVGKMPLTGNERLEFKFFTPSLSYGYDFTRKSGHPMYIYKISARQSISPRSQTYLLHFCSKEMIDNENKVIKDAQTSTYSGMVANIMKGELNLNSKKDFYFEPSQGIHKYVFPRLRPFDAIDNLSIDTRSSKFNNSGFYLYETSRGFNYRSLESMLAIEGNTARPVVARYRPKPSNVKDAGETNIKNEMQIAIHHKIKSQFDTLKNLRNGVYASKLVQFDNFYKTIKEYDFDYHKDYELTHHTEHGKGGIRTSEKSILPLHLREGKFLSDYAESTTYLNSNQQNLHNNIEVVPTAEILQKRLSQRMAFESFSLELTVPGFTGLQAGDLITFEMPSYAPHNDTEPLDHDPHMSGRYLVTDIRHQINRTQRKHFTVLTCKKDSVRRPYPEELTDTFINGEANREGIIDIYEVDKLFTDQLNNLEVFT